MNSAPLKVLLVEDSPSDAALLKESLTQSGLEHFEFTHVECWAEAAKTLRQGHFDVLLLDLSLPDSAGRDTFLQAHAEAPHLPIVVLTGIEDEVIGLDAVRHGIQDYLIKGQADGRQIARAIRYAIERKQAEEELQKLNRTLRAPSAGADSCSFIRLLAEAIRLSSITVKPRLPRLFQTCTPGRNRSFWKRSAK